VSATRLLPAATAPVPRQRANRRLLDRGAWLHAAADAVAEGGFGNLRILMLAKQLGVTRGSFYWHFRDHADLVRAFLDYWLEFRRARMAHWSRLITEDDAEQALLHALQLGFDEGRNSYRNIRVELAVRDLAARDVYAARVLATSDGLRYARIVDLYARLTGDMGRARVLAQINYLVIAGADLVLQGPRRNDSMVDDIRTLVGELLVRSQKRKGPSQQPR